MCTVLSRHRVECDQQQVLKSRRVVVGDGRPCYLRCLRRAGWSNDDSDRSGWRYWPPLRDGLLVLGHRSRHLAEAEGRPRTGRLGRLPAAVLRLPVPSRRHRRRRLRWRRRRIRSPARVVSLRLNHAVGSDAAAEATRSRYVESVSGKPNERR